MTAALSVTSEPAHPDLRDLVRDDRVAGRLYTDPAVFDMEMELIFHRTWVYVGHVTEVPEPGDYVTRTIGRQPVILTRDDEGEVRVLMNRCSHRGNVLCMQPEGHVRSFRCDYHGWTFGRDGSLVGATFPQGFPPDFDKADHGLTPAPRQGTHRGFVFASLVAQGRSLEDHLGHAAEYLDHFADFTPGEVLLRSGCVRHRIDANWKMPFENSTDGYHPLFLHKSCTTEFHAEGMDHSRALGNASIVRTRNLGDGHGMLDFSDQNRTSGAALDFNKGRIPAEDRQAFVTALTERHGQEKAGSMLARGLSNLAVFPNLSLVFQDVRIFVPISVAHCEEHHFPSTLTGVPDTLNQGRVRANVLSYGGAGYLGADDAEIYERNQAGLEAKVDDWVHLSRGLGREEVLADGTRVGEASDETAQRSFWTRYREVMVDGLV